VGAWLVVHATGTAPARVGSLAFIGTHAKAPFICMTVRDRAARTMHARLSLLLNGCRWPITNAVTEALNSKIQ
jgi:hypothetical protein